MEASQLDHLIKLVIFVKAILSREIYLRDLNSVEKIIESFVKDYCKFYSINSMLSGVLELLHLVDCTKNSGPLNNINCFSFEFEQFKKLFSDKITTMNSANNFTI